MNPLDYLLTKFAVPAGAASPVRLHASRHRHLLQLWQELGYQVGVEVGVDAGQYSRRICQYIPGVQLTGVDPWRIYDEYPEGSTQEQMERRYRWAGRRVSGYDVKLVRATSLEAVQQFAPASVDFVFIDGNHEFDYVITDIIAWEKIVRPGGMLAGHDYLPGNPLKDGGYLSYGVMGAVDAYTAAHHIDPWFLFVRDRCPTWAWVKA